MIDFLTVTRVLKAITVIRVIKDISGFMNYNGNRLCYQSRNAGDNKMIEDYESKFEREGERKKGRYIL